MSNAHNTFRLYGALTVLLLILSPLASGQSDILPAPPPADDGLVGSLDSLDSNAPAPQTREEIQGELEALSAERKQLKSEVVYIRHRISTLERTSDSPDSTLDATARDTLAADMRQWQDRLGEAQTDLDRVTAKQAELFDLLRAISEVPDDNPVLHGYKLRVTVAEDDTFNGVYEISPASGNLVLPGLPRMYAVGKTPQEISRAIQRELKAANLIADAQVSVEVTYTPAPTDGIRTPAGRSGDDKRAPEFGTPTGHYDTDSIFMSPEHIQPEKQIRVIYFSGEVSNEGAWRIPTEFEEPTLVKSLLRVRFTQEADLSRVRVLRLIDGKGLIEEVDVRSILQGETTTADFLLEPDDVVVVPAKGAGENILYLSGEFSSPGVWEIPTGFEPTLAQTLLRVDLTEYSDLENVKVVRMTDNRAVVEEINVVKVLDGTGLTADFVLQPKDIITIPKKKSAENVLYLSGQVSSPGIWQIPPGFEPTIAKTLLRVQQTEFADLKRVRVLRLVNGKGVAKVIDVERILAGQGLVPDFTLEPNDIITVPMRGSGKGERIVYIRGEVGDPGQKQLPIDPTEEMTPYMAILMAGGPTANADLTNAELVRMEGAQTVRRRVNIAAILAGEASDEVMRHKDILIIPGRNKTKRVYLTGRISQPGILEIPPNENQTLYASIVHRGGFDRFANLRKVYVLRDTGDGMRERIPVNIKALRNGFIPDLILEDNDIVVVPEKFFSWGGDNN